MCEEGQLNQLLTTSQQRHCLSRPATAITPPDNVKAETDTVASAPATHNITCPLKAATRNGKAEKKALVPQRKAILHFDPVHLQFSRRQPVRLDLKPPTMVCLRVIVPAVLFAMDYFLRNLR